MQWQMSDIYNVDINILYINDILISAHVCIVYIYIYIYIYIYTELYAVWKCQGIPTFQQCLRGIYHQSTQTRHGTIFSQMIMSRGNKTQPTFRVVSRRQFDNLVLYYKRTEEKHPISMQYAMSQCYIGKRLTSSLQMNQLRHNYKPSCNIQLYKK